MLFCLDAHIFIDKRVEQHIFQRRHISSYNMKQNRFARKGLLCILFAALIAGMAQIEIPLPYVPISGQTLGVGLAATVLGSRLGLLTLITYAVSGAAGLPVFTGFDAGMAVLTGPTGGYIFGFIAAAFAIGYYLEKTAFTIKNALVANIMGMLIILLFGMTGLKYIADLNWLDAVQAGVIPFLITGVIKALLAGWLGIIIRNKLIETDIIIWD